MKSFFDTMRRFFPSRRFLLSFLLPLLLVTLLKSNAQAIPIQQIDINITCYDTPYSLSVYNQFSIFESAGIWPTPSYYDGFLPNTGVNTLATGGSPLVPGLYNYEVSVLVSDYSNLYIAMHGTFWGVKDAHGEPIFGAFVAEPPTGYVSDEEVYRNVEAPWISLKDIGPGFNMSGDLFVYFGNAFSDVTGYRVGTWELTTSPVPEPAAIFLFGTGLAVLAGIARRKNKD